MREPPQLPPGLVAYRQTPMFDEQTIPAGLLRQHRTRPGTWGVITVVEGRLRFRLLEPPAERVLLPGRPGIVAPEQPHEVAPDGPVRFFIEFYRATDAIPSVPLPQAPSEKTSVIPGRGRRPRTRNDVGLVQSGRRRRGGGG